MFKIAILTFSVCFCLNDTTAIRKNAGIINGNIAKPGDFPWMGALLLISPHIQICGASLISKDWVLTAAHCIGDPRGLEVCFGMTERNKPFTCSDVASRHPHPEYRHVFPFSNDIAALRLDKAVTFSELIKPIKLEVNHIEDGVTVTVSGYGRFSDPYLKYVTIKSIDQATCESYDRDAQVTSAHLCIHSNGAVQNACKGDSGSPIVSGWNTSSPVQVAIVSRGFASCDEGYPSINTRISSYRKWIKFVTNI